MPNFGDIVDEHARHLIRGALMQRDVDFGKGGTQSGYRYRQYVTGLGMGCRDREHAAVLRRILLANSPQVADLAHDQVNAAQHMLPGFGDPFEAFAVSGKYLDAQLFFQLNDGLGNTRLRGVKSFGGFGEVEVAPCGFLDKSELVKIHRDLLY
jgi:hypothetical protein